MNIDGQFNIGLALVSEKLNKLLFWFSKKKKSCFFGVYVCL